MPSYTLSCEFDVTRRVGWDDDDLGRHIDDVFDRLQQGSGMTGMEAEADLDTGRATVTMSYDVDRSTDAEHHGRAMLGVAIRSSGGGHSGLLPFGEEAHMKPQRGQWSGLRTPTWNVRQVNLQRDAD